MYTDVTKKVEREKLNHSPHNMMTRPLFLDWLKFGPRFGQRQASVDQFSLQF